MAMEGISVIVTGFCCFTISVTGIVRLIFRTSSSRLEIR